jgi:hypothetical protein
MQYAGRVMVPVEDSGNDLDPGAADKLFRPAFTTKTHGMGCRSAGRSSMRMTDNYGWPPTRGAAPFFRVTVSVDPGT